MRAAAFCSTASDHAPEDGDPTLYVTLNYDRVTSDFKGGAKPVPITVVRGAPGEYIAHAHRGCAQATVAAKRLTDVVDHTNRVHIARAARGAGGAGAGRREAEAAVGGNASTARAQKEKQQPKEAPCATSAGALRVAARAGARLGLLALALALASASWRRPRPLRRRRRRLLPADRRAERNAMQHAFAPPFWSRSTSGATAVSAAAMAVGGAGGGGGGDGGVAAVVLPLRAAVAAVS